MNLEDAVSGRAGPAGIRWLLLGSESLNTVRRALSALLPAPDMLRNCHLRHTKFRIKPHVKLSAYFDAGTSSNASGVRTRAIAVTWKPKWRSRKLAATPDVTALEEEALRAGLAAPFRRLTARVPAWGVYIQVSPLDVSFPQLVRISDPEYVRNMLASAKKSNGGLSVQKSSYAVTSIKYQPGQRHLLRYDSTEAGGGTVFAKVYSGGEGSRVFQATVRAADWLSAHLEGATCLRPLAYVPDDDVVLYPLLFGMPLNELLRRHNRETMSHLELAGRALSVLHQAPVWDGLLLPRNLEAEIEDVENKCDFVPMLSPSSGPAIHEVIERARVLYARLPQEPPAFTHGDFKAENLWATPNGIEVIDFDTSHLGDPAVDVGRFLADLVLWFDIRRQPGLTEARKRFLGGYATAARRERLLRARLFEALALVGNTGRRLSIFDHDWVTHVQRLVSRAAALLDDLDGAPE